jgi:hypothetical protein
MTQENREVLTEYHRMLRDILGTSTRDITIAIRGHEFPYLTRRDIAAYFALAGMMASRPMEYNVAMAKVAYVMADNMEAVRDSDAPETYGEYKAKRDAKEAET